MKTPVEEIQKTAQQFPVGKYKRILHEEQDFEILKYYTEQRGADGADVEVKTHILGQQAISIYALWRMVDCHSFKPVPQLDSTSPVYNEVKITIGEQLFQFNSFEDWVNHATRRYENAETNSQRSIAIDKVGRIVDSGREFMRARDENAFPVIVYRKII
jgi:hypothetical protein